MSRRRFVAIFIFTFITASLLVLSACSEKPNLYRIEKADPETHRALAGGEIVGGEGRYGAYAWLGIPYAQPPVGELRWRDPQPAKPWKGVRETLTFGGSCAQFTSEVGGVAGPRGMVAGGEDCLFLNVYSPPLKAEALPKGSDRLPVMLWIHGGGNSTGTSYLYEGGNLAVTQRAIVVTVQYRLGPIGWFRHAALRETARSETEKSGNFGTLDLIAALRWVRDNIAAFGGNPDNVTIFGESAGGRNVFSLLMSPEAKGLFHRAIAQSGAAYCSSQAEAENLENAADPGSAKSSAEIILALLQKEFGLDREAAKTKMAGMKNAELETYLRSKTAAQIIGSIKPARRINVYPQIFNDGVVISSECWETFKKPDGWNRVPFITGTNRDEARLFLFGDARFLELKAGILPRFVNEELFLKSADYITRFMKVASADRPAATMQAQEKNIYIYRFDWDEEPTVAGADLSKMLGAAHGFDVPFVFGRFHFGSALGNRVFTDENLPGRMSISNAMMAYWGEFARKGDPGKGTMGNQPRWVPYGSEKNQMVFDTPAGGGVRVEKSDVGPESIQAELMADKALNAEGRCEILQSRVYLGWGYTIEEYRAIEECKPYPFRIRSEL